MKLFNLNGARGAILGLLGLATLATSFDASAIPVFARQTGFKCVACHVGGMFPQLTSLGRMFKLTGYTLGNRPNLTDLVVNQDFPPIAILVQGARQYYNTTAAGNGNSPSSAFDVQVVSFFAGGKITDNVGAFMQWTGQKYSNAQSGSNVSFASSASIDNTEFRYADRKVSPTSDLIYGAYVNNRALMSDIYNNYGPWQSSWINYFNGGGAQAPTTYMMGESSQHLEAGVGTYVFLDKTWYAEVAIHKTMEHGPLSVITAGAGPAGDGTASVIDPSPYVRLAYNKEWGPSSFEVGLHGRYSYVHGINGVTAASDPAAPISTYHDTGVDAQYQYVLDPHYFSAHARVTREFMNNLTGGQLNYQGLAASNASDNLTEAYADAIYIYEAKYGFQLSFQNVMGSNDVGLYGMTPSGSPNWTSWTPHVFWAPWQNVRVGYMYTYYTQMGGVTSGNGLNLGGVKYSPQNFNTSMLYIGMLY